jgi:hypothetical protein
VYAVASQRLRGVWGFVGDDPPETIEEQRRSWGDFLFACSELRGMATAGLQEVWPLAVTEDQPYTLIEASPKDEVAHVVSSIAKAIPELGEPERKVAPGGGFEVVIYDVTREQINARQGLVLQWLDSDGEVLGDAIVVRPGSSAGGAPTAAATYRLTGLVLARTSLTGGLVAESEDAAITVNVDGQASYAGGQIVERLFVAGWHLVEIEGPAASDIPKRLTWRSSGGSTMNIEPEDMFALADTGVWLHVRQLQEGEAPPYMVQRFDFQPHFSSLDGVRVNATTPVPAGTRVLIDYYQGYWDAPVAGNYTFNVPATNQRIEVIIDGSVILDRSPSGGVSFGSAMLTKGEHLIELRFSDTGAAYIGGTIWATGPVTGEPFWLEARPFPRAADNDSAQTGALSSTP